MRYWLLILMFCAGFGLYAAEPVASRNELNEARDASTPQDFENSFDVLERLFKGGSYEQARQVCDLLLNNKYFSSIPPLVRESGVFSALSEQARGGLSAQYRELMAARKVRQMKREMVFFYRARSVYEQALIKRDNTGVRKGIDEFSYLAANLYSFESPQYQAQSYYWMGAAYFYLGEYNAAVKALREVAENSPSPALDVKSSLLLADSLRNLADIVGQRPEDRPSRSPLDLPEDPVKILKSRAALLREAEQELSKIFTIHPQSRYDAETELRLIGLRFQLKEYEDTERLAGDLLKRVTPGSENYAKASYYEANSVYLQGRIVEAVELFRKAIEGNKNASPAVKADLLYGYGWANARLAQSSSPESRLVSLTRAQAALRQAITLMSYGLKRQKAILNLAPVLIQMELYQDALGYLHDLLNDPRFTLQANYLAGMAASGAGSLEQAARYFNAVIEYSGGGAGSRITLDALLALAELERQRSAYAEAYEYFRMAQDSAVKQRQFDLVARASLGMAVAKAELGYFDSQRRQEAARRFAESLLALAAVSSSSLDDIHTMTRMLVFRAEALKQWSNAGTDNLDQAEDILKKLKGRLLPRLREDELKYVQGKVYYLKAQNLLKGMPLGFNSQVSEYDEIFEIYESSEEILNNSLAANPRGAISSRARYLLGSIYDSIADLKIRLAGFLRTRGLGAEAVVYEEEGVKGYQKSVKPLSLAIVDSLADAQLRIDARALIGKTYLALGRFNDDPVQFEKGLDEFRILVNEPTISPERKIEAVGDMATALSEKKRKQEAVNLLLPYITRNINTAIQASSILLELKQSRKAYEVLIEAIAAAGKRKGDDFSSVPEAIFIAHSLGLERANELARSPSEVKQQQEVSADALLRMSQSYPGSDWASKALLVYGNWMLDNGKWKEVISQVDAGLGKLRGQSRAVDTIQALYILKGKALMIAGKQSGSADYFNQARAEFARAERAATMSKLGRTQRAQAIREQGNAYRELGDTDEALRYYGRVFSIFYNEYHQADLARIAAAQIHAAQGNYELAVKIIDGGLDQKMLLQYKLLYRQKIKQQEGVR